LRDKRHTAIALRLVLDDMSRQFARLLAVGRRLYVCERLPFRDADALRRRVRGHDEQRERLQRLRQRVPERCEWTACVRQQRVRLHVQQRLSPVRQHMRQQPLDE
jgi:hypothetical protein